MQHKLAIALAVTLVLLSATAGFSQVTNQPVSARGTVTRPELPATPQTGSVRAIQAESAKLVCLHKIQVAAQSDGLIEDLLVDEGHLVTKGDTLLTIDSRVAAAELQVANKELEAAQKQAAQTAEVEYAKKASAVADEEYKAENELYNRGASTFSQAQRKRLEAERSRLGIEVAEVKHETEELAADVAKAKLDAAQVKLGLYSIVAPYDGVIVARIRDRGEWIRAGEPVLRLLHMNEMKVEAVVRLDGSFSFSDLQDAPMTVTIKLNPAQVIEVPTQVEFVNPEINADRVTVLAKIQNQKAGDVWLLGDGMTATADLKITVK